MVKSQSLSSDLDLIKEVEELRLKQKLLVESLKQKQESQLTSDLHDIHTKLDFLVKIFKDANSSSEEEEDKFEALEEKFETQFKQQEKVYLEKLNSLESSLLDISTLLSHVKSPFPAEKKPIVNNDSKEVSPPKPDFSLEHSSIEDKVQTIDTKPKKKKGWF